MRIAVASDHAGYRVKTILAVDLARGGHEVVDFGTDSESPVDYPDFIRPAAEAVARGDCDRAIVLGGSGNGEAMVANRTTGVRCALCWNVDSRDAIVREMREETGLDVRVLRLLYLADKPEDGLLHITFELGRRGGDLRRPDNEHDANPIADVRFVGVEDLCERGFSQTWRDLVLNGFADAPAYVGHKRNLGL